MAHRFQISAKLLNWPKACVCCLGDSDSKVRITASRTTGKRVKTTTTSGWDVPYCSTCALHKSKHDEAAAWIAGGIMLGALSLIGIWLWLGSGMLGSFAAIALFGSSLVPSSSASRRSRALMKEGCVSTDVPVRYIQWHGTVHTFEFDNKVYMDSFILSNHRKQMSDVEER